MRENFSGVNGAGPPENCVSQISSVRPASRCSSSSPTHTMGVRPAASAAFVFFATVCSVSPKNCRRSECPMITKQTKAARSEEHTSELQSHLNLVCRLLLEKKKKRKETL